MIAVVDTGPLIAATSRDEPNHERSLAVLRQSDLRLVVPALVVAEACYTLGRRAGPSVEAGFLRGLEGYEVEAPAPEDWPRMAELVEQYADFPLGGTDASVIALAERLDTPVIVTLDRRHFGAIRPRHCPAFELLPE